MSVKTESGTEYLLALLDAQGIACSTVSDGHIIAMKKSKLIEILNLVEKQGKDSFVMFIKRSTTTALS